MIYKMKFRKSISLLTLLLIATIGFAGSPVKVMTWNIRYDNPDDGVNRWDNRKEEVAGLIQNYKADIIFLQEVLHNQYLYLQYLLNYGTYGVGRDDGKEAGEYAPVFYNKARFLALNQGHFWLAEDPARPSKGWDAACIRIATWMELKDKLSGDTVLVINTHFDHMGDTARLESARLIADFCYQKAGNHPLIVCGDFNCTLDSPALKTLRSNASLLTGQATANRENLPGFTYCGFDGKGKDGDIIDFIFYRSFATAGNYAIITDRKGRNYPSDHLPVYLELTYQH